MIFRYVIQSKDNPALMWGECNTWTFKRAKHFANMGDAAFVLAQLSNAKIVKIKCDWRQAFQIENVPLPKH